MARLRSTASLNPRSLLIPDRRSGSCRGERAPRSLNATVTDVAKAARQTLEDDRLSATLTAEVNKRLSRQDDQLDVLEARVRQLGWENRRDGGWPWGLILVGGYLLYRFNSTVQERIEGLFGQADPGTKGILNRASVAVKDAAQAVVHGEAPGSAVKTAGGELKRAGEKTADAAQNKLDGLMK